MSIAADLRWDQDYASSTSSLPSVAAFFLTPFVIRSLGDHSYGLWLLVAGFIGYYGLF
ncbi:MAG: hypothetical protein ACRD24_02570 [Terriglobales bacterium]